MKSASVILSGFIVSLLFFCVWQPAFSANSDSAAIIPPISAASGLGSVVDSKSKSLPRNRYIDMGQITWSGGPADSYLDVDSLIIDQGVIEIISLKNFPSERFLNAKSYRSETNRINLDCMGRRFRLLDAAKYSELFANGVQIESTNFALQGYSKWSEVNQGSLMERILNSSCYLAEKKH